jgi:predicted nucleic acid-binding protein
MIAACVIDASVVIKWVITEEGTEAANRLRRTGTAFHAPDLIVPEAGNILWKKVRRDELTEAEAELASGILRLAKIQIHAMGPQALLALQMAAKLEHPVYDTTYLALARALDLPMVTADRRLVNKLAAAGSYAFHEVVLLS